jgi:hypothetical protein
MIELMDLAMEMSKDIQYLKAYIEALKNQKAIPNALIENPDPTFDINLTTPPKKLNYILK